MKPLGTEIINKIHRSSDDLLRSQVSKHVMLVVSIKVGEKTRSHDMETFIWNGKHLQLQRLLLEILK